MTVYLRATWVVSMTGRITDIEGDEVHVLGYLPDITNEDLQSELGRFRAGRFERGRKMLEAGGRFYLVTKQPNEVGAVVAEEFGSLEAEERRGYVILSS